MEISREMAQEISDIDHQMHALVLRGKEQIGLELRTRPTPGAGELLVRIHAAGLCGTDATEYRHGPRLADPGRVRRHGHVLGHEFSGTVAAGGPGTRMAPGTPVVSGAGIPCRDCSYCQRGETNLCNNYSSIGLQHDGTLAEYCVIPEHVCVDISEAGISLDTAALAQPAGIALHAVSLSPVFADERALVIGAGGVGLFVAAALEARGSQVVVHDRSTDQTLTAAAICPNATTTIELATSDVDFDVVYECTGSDSALHQSLHRVRRGGTVMLVGLHPTPREIDLLDVTLRQVTLMGSSAQTPVTDISAALQLLAVEPERWSAIAPRAIPMALATELFFDNAQRPTKTLVDPWVDQIRPTQHGRE
ncbi:zinc-dependent alcohol dehydrogenase [Nocardioides sp. J54]|uniref:zinc-dependent alcohol dehydrogenase n=1 Tax=Nocardioides sp. J54 TaxID=935866 RepID=UPI00048BB4C2|nr:alcohol dehydrogenase catalytic domain-containing protein [Nocardioides sp. J54]